MSKELFTQQLLTSSLNHEYKIISPVTLVVVGCLVGLVLGWINELNKRNRRRPPRRL